MSKTKILIRNIDRRISSEKLQILLRDTTGNKNIHVDIIHDKTTGENSGKAIVELSSPDQVKSILNSIVVIEGQQIEMSPLETL